MTFVVLCFVDPATCMDDACTPYLVVWYGTDTQCGYMYDLVHANLHTILQLSSHSSWAKNPQFSSNRTV